MWHLVNFSLGSIRVNTSLRALVLPLSTHPLLTANEIGCTDQRGSSMVLLVLLLPRLPNVVVAAAALLMLLSEDALQFEALWLRSDPRAPISYLFFCALDGAGQGAVETMQVWGSSLAHKWVLQDSSRCLQVICRWTQMLSLMCFIAFVCQFFSLYLSANARLFLLL